MAKRSWILLTYKVPADPSRGRVRIWRKIKALGAVYLQFGVWLLPKSEDHQRHLKMLVRDIEQAGGDSVLLETAALDPAQEQKVVAHFVADRDDAYVEFVKRCADVERDITKETNARHFTYPELKENEKELKKLQSWLARIRKLDFYGTPRASEAADSLAKCKAVLDAYAQRVFDADEKSRDDRF